MANLILAATGSKAGIRFAERRKWDTKSRLLASIDRARTVIGYDPRTTFETGLERTVQWFRDHRERIDAAARFGPGASSAVRS